MLGKVFHRIYERCAATTFHKRFFVAKNGYFGLGPSSHTKGGLLAWLTAFEGDGIFALSGCGLRVIMRLDTSGGEPFSAAG